MNGLNKAQLREIEIEALLGRGASADDTRAMAETLLAMLDEAGVAGEPNDDVDDLVGTIARLEKLRAEAVDTEAEAEAEHEREVERLKSEHATELDELARTADEYRARAEKAEHALEVFEAVAKTPARRRKGAEDGR